jgi:hypothetical protein
MRKHEEKDMGIIVVPIFVKNSSNVDDCQIDTSKFSSIFRIASCLGSIDAMFATLLDYGSNSNFRRQTDFNVRQFMSDHIKVVGIDPVDKEYVKSMEEKIKLLFVTGSKREFNNELMLRKLKKFCETHNRLPSRVKPEELSLFYFTSLVHVQTASPETKAMIQPIVDKFGTKKIDLPIEDQFSILEKWVRENKRFPYYGYGRSKQSRKELFEAKGMTITDEELYLRQWMTYKIANKKFTPELKERLSDLKEWVSEVSPTIAQLVKKHNLCSSSSALKQKLVKLGVEPHYCSPGNRPTVLWDIEKVRAALNLP